KRCVNFTGFNANTKSVYIPMIDLSSIPSYTSFFNGSSVAESGIGDLVSDSELLWMDNAFQDQSHPQQKAYNVLIILTCEGHMHYIDNSLGERE
ncbi:hypothetical protein L9F63_018224, partial [Diploptera punctata]